MHKIVDPAGCTACDIGHHREGGKAVPGVGNTSAQIMIVGEAPGKNEAAMGIPFVGDSGKLLNEALTNVGLKRDDLYITNVCKCWPYLKEEDPHTGALRTINRTPGPIEIENCKRFINAEIQAVNPKVIIALGATALGALEGKENIKILSRRGQAAMLPKSSTFIMPTVHPSYVVRNGGLWASGLTGKTFTQTGKLLVEDLREAVNLANGKIKLIEKCYRLVDSREKLKRVIETIIEVGRFTFDIETTGLELTSKVIGIGFGIDEGTACYIPFLYKDMFDDTPADFWADKDITREEVIAQIKIILEDETLAKSAHNAKFDMGILETDFQIDVKGLAWDTLCGSYLWDENADHGLKDLKDRYIDLLGYEDPWNRATKNGKNALDAPLDVAVTYCCSDADATYRETKRQKELFESHPNLMWLMENFYVPIMYIVRDIEVDGVAYDKDTALKIKMSYEDKQLLIKKKIYELIPEAGEFNIGSDEQVRKVLYGILKLKAPFETKTAREKRETKRAPKKKKHEKSVFDFISADEGAFEDSKGSTDKKALEILAKENPVAKYITEYRHYGHTISTYIDGRIAILGPDSRVHISINPVGTDTGRFSAEGSQNIPKLPEIKGLHVAPVGSKLVSVDLSQAEVRCFAHYANEDVLRSAFAAENIDVHCLVASEVNKIPYDEFYHKAVVLKLPEYVKMRSAAKGTVFGLLYGRGPASIAAEYNLQLEEAEDFIVRFFGRFPNCKKWIDETHTFVTKNGYVYNMFGRIRHLPWVSSEKHDIVAKAKRQAVNSIIQATAADITNLALIKIWNAFKRHNLPTKIVLQVHDCIVTETPDEYVHNVERLMVDIMETKPHPEFSVKMKADADIYQAWGISLDH